MAKQTLTKKPVAARVKGGMGISVKAGRTLRVQKTHKAHMPAGSVVHFAELSPVVRNMRQSLGVSQEELGRVTGFSTRSIAGWESGKPLSDAARKKLVEVDRLRTALAEIIEPAKVGLWMRTPNPAFEGQTPIQIIERGESDRLWRMIFQIHAGAAS